MRATRLILFESVGAWHSFLTDLECTACGLRHDADVLQTVCTACGKVLYARYDLDGVRQAVRPEDFSRRRWEASFGIYP